jgi:hypothetical protein
VRALGPGCSPPVSSCSWAIDNFAIVLPMALSVALVAIANRLVGLDRFLELR